LVKQMLEGLVALLAVELANLQVDWGFNDGQGVDALEEDELDDLKELYFLTLLLLLLYFFLQGFITIEPYF
jgi:hypothetical protein